MQHYTIDVFVIDDTTPFGLSLSKPFEKLRANGSEMTVMIYESLHSMKELQKLLQQSLIAACAAIIFEAPVDVTF